jgi:hypothetical protein
MNRRYDNMIDDKSSSQKSSVYQNVLSSQLQLNKGELPINPIYAPGRN